MLLFDILGSIVGSVAENVEDKIDETKKYYEEFSRKTEYWDDERVKREYEKIAAGGDFARKAAMVKIMQERGLINS